MLGNMVLENTRRRIDVSIFLFGLGLVVILFVIELIAIVIVLMKDYSEIDDIINELEDKTLENNWR
jgi:hypothetical protein